MNTSNKIEEVELEITNCKTQVESVIVNVLERGDKLEELESKAEELKDSASVFHKQTNKVCRKMWWQKSRLHLCIAIVVVVIVGLIILAIVL